MALRLVALTVASLFTFVSAASASSLSLERILTSNGAETDVSYPIQVTHAPGDTRNLYILDRVDGTVKLYDRESQTLSSQNYLQLPTDLFVKNDFPYSNFQAYSVTFDPNFQNSNKLYVSFIDPAENLRVVEFTADPNNPAVVETSTYRNIISVSYGANSGHQGGDLDFGPDGNLYLTTGDNRAPYTPNAEISTQDLNSLEGKILRFNPNSADAFPDDPLNNFTPPADNPIVVSAVTPGSVPKVIDAIWASGLRNPYQAAFDPKTGTYIIADVGEDKFEELNLGIAGANYGWPLREGSSEHPPGTINVGGLTFTDPLYEYPHASLEAGGSITGGLFYYGDNDALQGKYIFGDFVSNEIWSLDIAAGGTDASNLIEYTLLSGDPLPNGLLSFGSGPDGEIYIVAINGIYRVTGATVSAIPLPASALLLASGVGVAGAMSRRRRIK